LMSFQLRFCLQMSTCVSVLSVEGLGPKVDGGTAWGVGESWVSSWGGFGRNGEETETERERERERERDKGTETEIERQACLLRRNRQRQRWRRRHQTHYQPREAHTNTHTHTHTCDPVEVEGEFGDVEGLEFGVWGVETL
jgi:hypothetical protein